MGPSERCDSIRREGVGHVAHAALGHLEHAHLVGGSETVFPGPQDAEPAGLLGLQVQHHVYHVLQDPGPGQVAVLGHVAGNEHRRLPSLGPTQQLQPGLPHLGHAARPGGLGVAVQSLDGVYDDQGRTRFFQPSKDYVQVRLGQEQDVLANDVEPLGAQLDLLGRLLAADVEHTALRRRHRVGELQEQRRLADPRLSGQQHH